MALDDFIDSMVRVGNLDWNLIKSEDILDYKIFTKRKSNKNNSNNDSNKNNNNNDSINNDNKEEEKSDSIETEVECKTKEKDSNTNNNNNNNDEDNNSESMSPRSNSNSKFSKPTKHSPKILPMGQRVKVPSSLYTQYDLIDDEDEKKWVRNSEKKFSDNYNISTITIIINPNCELIKKYPGSWSKVLMSGFNLYHVNDFSDYNSNNKNENLILNLAFIEPLCYYHIYFNAPQQVMAGNNWNEKIATFFYQSFNHMDYHPFDYRDILAVKKWGNKYKGRVSCYIKGKKPEILPKHIQIGRSKSIKLRVYQDEINETQKRALEIPKCYACYQYGHNVIQCPTAQKERSKYIKEIVKRINISQSKRKELIKNWKFKPKLCPNCGQKKHESESCPNIAHCIVCDEDGHKSGKKSLECKKLITLAKATLRFDFQFTKCCVANNIIPPLPLNGEDYNLNVPWVFNKQWDPNSNKWTTIVGWRQKWDENCNIGGKYSEKSMEIDTEEKNNDKSEIEDSTQSYRETVNQQLEKFKQECKQEMARLQNELKEKKQKYNNDLATMKQEYKEMKTHIEHKRAKVDKLILSEQELTKKCKKLTKRVNKMNRDLNNQKNKNTHSTNKDKTRVSEQEDDSDSHSSSESSVKESVGQLHTDSELQVEDKPPRSGQDMGMGNIQLSNQNKVKDKDKRMVSKKRKYVSPPKQPNLGPNSPNTNTNTNVKQQQKKRRTVSNFKKHHQTMVENNNSTFNNESSRITLEQAADGITPAPTANQLPLETESKDADSTVEEEDDDDVAIIGNNEMAKYMSTRVDDSNNNGNDNKNTDAEKLNSSEDDI